MKTSELSELIMIRAYTHSVIDNVWIKLSTDEVRALQSKLTMLDKKIIASIICLELNAPVVESPKKKNETTK